MAQENIEKHAEDLLNNRQMKIKLLDHAAAMLINQKELEPSDLAGITAQFGYFMDIRGHGIEALFKIIKGEKIWYIALQKQSLKLLTINEEQFQSVTKTMLDMHLNNR